jgi:hypothetical protein
VLSLLGSVGQSALRLVTQGQVHRNGNLRLLREALLDLLSDGHGTIARFQKRLKGFPVLAKKPEQKVVRFDPLAAGLTRFVSGKEDGSASLFDVPFEHGSPAPILAIPRVKRIACRYN